MQRVGAGANGQADEHRGSDEDRRGSHQENDEKQGIVPIH
jgi:hypothetical protein